MNSRTRLTIASAALVLTFLGVHAWRTLRPSDAVWRAQIAADTDTAVQVLDGMREGRLPVDLGGMDEFWEKWDRRMRLYDDEHRGRLRQRLRTYVDFLEGESEAAARLYTTGERPDRLPEKVQDGRARVRVELPERAGAFVEAADRLREAAFRASPAHSGWDPDLPDFEHEHELVGQWAEAAREQVDRLTEDPERRTGVRRH